MNYNIAHFLKISEASTDDDFHDTSFFWDVIASTTTFPTSNGEFHAFLLLSSLDHIIGWKVKIGTGDWLY